MRTGLLKWRIFLALASEDINDQHRRTTLGPLWLLINYLAIAGTFILIFGQSAGVENYAAHVALGLFVWLYLSETITRSVTLFMREESFSKGTPLSLSVYVFRLSTQSVIRAGYMWIGCLALVVLSGIGVSADWAYGLFGFALIVAATPALIIVFSFIGAFFPDSQFLISNIMRLGMFLTPIFWAPGPGDGLRQTLASWNPFSYFLDIVRAPVVSGSMPIQSLAFCAGLSTAFWLVALLLLGKFRKKVVFVL